LIGIEGRARHWLAESGESRVREIELALLEIERDLGPRGATAGKRGPPPFASISPPRFAGGGAAGFVSRCFIEFSLFRSFSGFREAGKCSSVAADCVKAGR
jgi:hypothetical protein